MHCLAYGLTISVLPNCHHCVQYEVHETPAFFASCLGIILLECYILSFEQVATKVFRKIFRSFLLYCIENVNGKQSQPKRL